MKPASSLTSRTCRALLQPCHTTLHRCYTTPTYSYTFVALEAAFAPGSDRSSWSTLHHACAAGRAFDVASLLQPRDGPPRAHMHSVTGDPFRLTPLHIAARFGHRNIVTFLTLRGADIYHGCGIEGALYEWVTPLHVALHHGHVDACKGFHAARQLVELDPDFTHSAGGPSLLQSAAIACACHPRDVCTCNVRTPLLRMLIDAGARVDGPNGRAALAAARMQQRDDSITLLLAAGAPRSVGEVLRTSSSPHHVVRDPTAEHVGRMFAATATDRR